MSNEKFKDLTALVQTLVGPIIPVGETNYDKKCYENVKELTLLIDNLLYQLLEVSNCRTRQEASIKKVGEHVWDWIIDIGGSLDDILEE
jgi:hypothetical protein